MKFSSSGHLEAEHPLYDLIFGPKQSPKLGFANNKMAKNGLNRKNTVYQPYTDRIPTIYRPYTDRIPTVYRPYTKESIENINVYKKNITVYQTVYQKTKGTVYQPYTDRIPSVLLTNAKNCSINNMERSNRLFSHSAMLGAAYPLIETNLQPRIDHVWLGAVYPLLQQSHLTWSGASAYFCR